MKNWLYFIGTRIPVIPNIILTLGIVKSGHALTQGELNTSLMSWSALVIMVFLIELRLMDEIKDLEKDKVAHPHRPLPSGKLDLVLYQKVVWAGLFLFLSFTPISFMINSCAGFYLLISQIWLWLMYKEFFVGEWLENRPFFYAVTHQIIIIPLVFFMFSLTGNLVDYFIEAKAFALICLSSFFSYELARKLDTNSHPILKGYGQVYGHNKVILVLFSLLSMGLWGLWPFEGMVKTLGTISYLISLFSLILLKIFPQKFKWVEGIISLHVIITMWMLIIK